MQATGKGNSSGTCLWQMQSTSLPPRQEAARVAGVTANTGCCDQAGFLPLTTLSTSVMTQQCPTARESNYSFTSLTHPLQFAPLPPSPGYCQFKDTRPRRSSTALAKATTQSPAAPAPTGMGLNLCFHS